MANTIRIKRRSSVGAAGSPTNLSPAELAYNENDNTLYYGYGDGGSGLSSSVIPIAGSGAFMTTGTTQTISAAKTFSNITITGGSISGITDLAVADGGTGSSTASGARANLSAAVLGANSDITSITGLTTALTVAQGGTGSVTASGARTNLLPTYATNGGKLLAVNSGATDVEYITPNFGTVTSVGINMPLQNIMTVGFSPVTTSGNISLTFNAQAMNTMLMGPVSGANAIPAFRTILSTDIPALNYASTGTNSNITSLTGLTTALSIPQGGTGSTTAAAALTALGAYPATNPDGYTTNTGTVTSVQIIGDPTVFNFTMMGGQTTITTAGTLSVTLAAQAKNKVLIGGVSTTTIPTFRLLDPLDIPALAYLPITGGTVSGAVVITGDLTVSGTTTTVSSSTLTVADKNIELAMGSSTEAGATGGGITLHGLVDHTILYTTGTSSWDFSEHMNLVTGKAYKINGVSVLSATALDGVVVDGGTF